MKNSAILDSGTTIHIFNEITRFLDFRTAPDVDFVWAGDSRVPILGYGDVDIQALGPKGKMQILMAMVELIPYKERASRQVVRTYQRKIGSLLYAAVTTRIDIAFAVPRLARFLTNPGPEHHAAADRVLLYLYRHRGLGLQLGGANDFLVATDASFADNTLDRKSSQAYVMVLFGGVVGWRANKQNTVTTSTTEAELLSLSQGAKEGQFIKRLLDELSLSLDDQQIRIHCNNRQTIRLVTKEIARLLSELPWAGSTNPSDQ